MYREKNHMIRILLMFFALTSVVLSNGENVILTEAKELKHSVILGRVKNVDTSKPVIVVSALTDTGKNVEYGFFKVQISIEEEIYHYENGKGFATTLPNLAPKTKDILVRTRSLDPNHWSGLAIAETRIFIVGRAYLGAAFFDVSIGSLEPSEREVIKRKIAESIYDQMKYTKDWMKWNLDK
jgi:hypothetical protein